ncbi:MAG: AraC family transcriptional regulator [Rhodoplanes sp.]|uniref:helix-turn-helix transcriptional regulator n=1 Tax=Rhodoplanes sp. TaxID=1968906 RepID=UPI0018496793|nr:AraC family transcriptional regulator [Rhodoplanes sp.]NVO14527.1 AraC family transcriptional regulator [Rhodoplanes sp.]
MPEAAVFSFSTDELSVEDRLPVWVEVIGRQFMRLNVELRDRCTVAAAINVVRLGRAEIGSTSSPPGLYCRTRALANDGNGDFTFFYAERGRMRIAPHETGGDFIDLEERGGGAIGFHGASGRYDFEDRARIIGLRVDGDTLRRAAPGLDERFCHLRRSNDAVRLLIAYIDRLRTVGPPADPELGRLVEAHLIDLIAFTARPNDDTRDRAAARAIPAARLAAMRDDVAANLSRMTLSAREVARRHGVSERYVQLLFEQSGTSFSRFVTAARLERAMAMLRDPGCAHLRVGDIAFAVGFADLTTFNRNFRHAYGDTPRAIRRTAWAGDEFR